MFVLFIMQDRKTNLVAYMLAKLGFQLENANFCVEEVPDAAKDLVT